MFLKPGRPFGFQERVYAPQLAQNETGIINRPKSKGEALISQSQQWHLFTCIDCLKNCCEKILENVSCIDCLKKCCEKIPEK